MSGRDIKIPFGPDKTGGLPLDAIPAEGEEPYRDPFEAPTTDPINPVSPVEPSASSLAATLPSTMELPTTAQEVRDAPFDAGFGAPMQDEAQTARRAQEYDQVSDRAPSQMSSEMPGQVLVSGESFDQEQAIGQTADGSYAEPALGLAHETNEAPSAISAGARFASGEGADAFEGANVVRTAASVTPATSAVSAAQVDAAPAISAAPADAASDDVAPADAAFTSAAPADVTAPVAFDETAETADAVEYHPGGYTDEEATAQGMDPMQMSILALKDSIDQGRQLKEREKERKELAEALEADHAELADRENILANYQSLVAEQDAIIADCMQRRDAAKNELSQLTVALEQNQAQLEAIRGQQAQQLQPLETDLGRARAAADQAKNDERSRKAELNSSESELRKASEQEANVMAIARHDQAKAAYEDARARSDRAKEQLSEIQKAFDETKQRFEQARGPLERNIQDIKIRTEHLKEDINSLGEQLSAARNRRQYCDTVYQYPNETAQMRSEVEEAEALARRMDAEIDALREKLAQSKKKARTAKLAIAAVIVIIIVIVVAFIAVSNR